MDGTSYRPASSSVKAPRHQWRTSLLTGLDRFRVGFCSDGAHSRLVWAAFRHAESDCGGQDYSGLSASAPLVSDAAMPENCSSASCRSSTILTCPLQTGPESEIRGLGHGGRSIARKQYTVEQVIGLLRQADVELGKGRKIPEICKTLGIHEVMYYRWRREYGGSKVDQAKRLKKLDAENARLKRIVASQGLDIAIRKEAADPNLRARRSDAGWSATWSSVCA